MIHEQKNEIINSSLIFQMFTMVQVVVWMWVVYLYISYSELYLGPVLVNSF